MIPDDERNDVRMLMAARIAAGMLSNPINDRAETSEVARNAIQVADEIIRQVEESA